MMPVAELTPAPVPVLAVVAIIGAVLIVGTAPTRWFREQASQEPTKVRVPLKLARVAFRLMGFTWLAIAITGMLHHLVQAA